MENKPKILLLGIGSIGGIIASQLIKGNFVSCTLVTNNDGITKAIKELGLEVNDVKKEEKINVRAQNIFTKLEQVTGTFDYIFFMMKAKHIDNTILQAKNYLNPSGYVVSFQNGLVHEKFYQIYGNQMIIAIVLFNSIMIKPGTYILSKSESIVIGTPYPIESGILEELQYILSPVTDCQITNNILGTCWTKLAINCAINSLTAITGRPLGEVLKKKFGKETFFAIIQEVIDVAEKLEIKLAKVKIDPYLLYQTVNTPFFKKCMQIVMINKIAKKYSTIYPSMLQDIKKGKITEIDYLNGYISNVGKQLNVPTPANDEMVNLIKKIETNLLKPDPYLLKIAYEIPIVNKGLEKPNISV